MTVSSEVSRIDYVGSGILGPYAIPYKFLDDDDVKVVKQSTAGVESTLILNSDYTLTGAGNPLGGTLNLTVAHGVLSASFTLSIIRNPLRLQETDYTPNDKFPAESHETALDKLTMIAQRNYDLILRSLRFPDSDINISGLLPARNARKSLYLAFDANGNPITVAGTLLSGDVSGYSVLATEGLTAKALRDRFNKIRNVVDDFGAAGDGLTDDTAAFQNALIACAGKALYIPDPFIGYVITSSLTIPDNTILFGDGKYSTRIILSADVNLIGSLGSGVCLQNLYLDGNQHIGFGIQVPNGKTQQQLLHCKITDFNNTCINFASTTAGSGFTSVGCLAYRYNAAQGSGKYAVVVDDSAQLAANPRKFVNFETGGTPSFSFGGSNSFYVSNSFLSDLAFSANSAAVLLSNCRVATVQDFTIFGGQNMIVGCDVYPKITLGAGAGGCVIGPNAYNTFMPVDNSGNGTNLIYHWDEAYTPAFTASGGGALVGDGTIVGRFARNGQEVHGGIQFTFGGTTNFGAGILQFSLPANASCTYPIGQICGQWRVTNAATGLLFFGDVVLAASGPRIELQRDITNGLLGAANQYIDMAAAPQVFNLAAADVLTVNWTYKV